MNTAAPHRFPGPLWYLRKRVTVAGAILKTAVGSYVLPRTGQTRTQSLFCIRAVINGRDLVRTQCTKGRSNSPNFGPILEKENTLRTSLPNSQTTLRASNFPSIYCFARISECPLGTSLAAPCSLITGRILVPGRGTFLARGSAAKTALPS